MTQKKSYNKRTWLNKPSSPSTGSIVAFHGPAKYSRKEADIWTWLEISDCTFKIRLHKTNDDTLKDFVNKLKKLRNAVDDFIKFLEKLI